MPGGSPEASLRRAGGTTETLEQQQSISRRRAASEKKAPPPDTLRLVDPRTLHGLVVPEREWIVQDWLPTGYVTALYGDGGTGKSLLVQQLMTSCATGVPWLGLATARCKALGLFCEDDEDELHRRQDAINAAMGISFCALQDVRWFSGVGHDNAAVKALHNDANATLPTP